MHMSKLYTLNMRVRVTVNAFPATSLKPRNAEVHSLNTSCCLTMPIDYSKWDRLAASLGASSEEGSSGSESEELESDITTLPPGIMSEAEAENGSFGSFCRSTLALAKRKLPSGPRTHFMQDCWTQQTSLCAQVWMDVAMMRSISTTWPSGACGKQSAKTLRKRCREQWVRCCPQRGSAACS